MKRNFQTWFKIIKAYVDCNWYLLTKGMRDGECQLSMHGHKGELIYLGTCTGSLFQNNLKHTKVFYTV